MHGITNKIMLPKMPAVKLKAVWIWFLAKKLTSRMIASSEMEKASVDFETLLGLIEGKKMPNTFSRMTMM